jgi:hypothetical protein
MDATGQTPLAELQRKFALAQAMATAQPGQYKTPVGSALGGLAQILAARNANKLGTQVEEQETAQRQADLSILSQLISGGDADVSAINDDRYAALAMQMMADRNAPVSPVSVSPGSTLINPRTGEVVASGGPERPRMVATGIPGLLYDQNSGQNVDVLASVMAGPQSVGNPANPMGVNVDAPAQATPPAASMGGWRETPAQQRAAQAEIAATAREDQARLTRETAEQKEQLKQEKEEEAAAKIRAEGARDSLADVNEIRRIVAEYRDAGGDPNDLFGALQSGEGGWIGAGVRGVSRMVGTKAESYRQRLERVLGKMELNVAKLYLKGGGAISDSERAIAKQIVPKLSLNDWNTANGFLGDIIGESYANAAPDQVIISWHPQYGDITKADIDETMRQTGKTFQQILRDFGEL